MESFEFIKEEFELRGETISDWANREGFKAKNVYAVLSGRNRGIRGEAHRIAVRLGLKPNPEKTMKERK